MLLLALQMAQGLHETGVFFEGGGGGNLFITPLGGGGNRYLFSHSGS